MGNMDIHEEIFGKATEQYVDPETAREILESPGYDAYGSVRLYGELSDGQSIAIKSVQNLEKYNPVKVRVVSR